MNAKRKITDCFQVKCEKGVPYMILARSSCEPSSLQIPSTLYCTDQGASVTRVDEQTFVLQNGTNAYLS